MNTPQVTVSAVNLFPVRSCAGQSMSEAEVTANGLTFDRQWRLIGGNGRFLTQRECPKMAVIRPSIVDGQLQLHFAGETLQSAAGPAVKENADRALVPVYENWSGIDQGDEIAAWLSTVLGVEARLLRVVPAQSRTKISEDFTRPDMSPVLVISEESLADLNSRLPEPVLMNRFRPNIVIRGGQPYEEESWTRVVIGDVVYEASTEPCGRCPMINVDQEKGERSGKDPLKTLAGYRRLQGVVLFGKYMVPQSRGVVRVGDSIFCDQ